MKKILAGLLITAMLLSLSGCNQTPEAASAPETPSAAPAATAAPATVTVTAAPATVTVSAASAAGDIEAARAAYANLSEEDKTLLYEEIAAERKAAEDARTAAANAWLTSLLPSLIGEWNMELGTPGDNSHFAYKLVLNEDMTYEYGQQQGTWEISEGTILLQNAEDGVYYFQLIAFEEDGFIKLLCADRYCYVRSADYEAAFDRKFVTVRFSELGQYIGPLQYVGNVGPGVWDGPTGDVYIFDSLAYDMGLIYIGTGERFEMELTVQLPDGFSYAGKMFSPFELQYLDVPYTASDIFAARAPVYFVRAEYVDKVVIQDGNREIYLTCGSVHYDSSSFGWDNFPEGTYENFAF